MGNLSWVIPLSVKGMPALDHDMSSSGKADHAVDGGPKSRMLMVESD